MKNNTIIGNDIVLRAPVDSMALRLIQNRGAVNDEIFEMDSKIDQLHQLLIDVECKLTEIEVTLREQSINYHKYGLESKEGEYRKLKMDQSNYNHSRRLILFEIERCKREIAKRQRNAVAFKFLRICQEEMPSDKFNAILRRAESTIALNKE